jgi:hypothetical protein
VTNISACAAFQTTKSNFAIAFPFAGTVIF